MLNYDRLDLQQPAATRYRASATQSWVTLGAIAFLVGLYAITGSGTPTAYYHASSGYWPNSTPGLSIPYAGATYHVAEAAQPVAFDGTALVPVGEHDGVTFYALKGGGGGMGQPSPRLYVADGSGRFLPLERLPVDPTAGQFMR